MPGYRHELKLLIREAEYLSLRSRLSFLLPADSNARESGDYFIRSLYFDDAAMTSYYEKLSGVADRRKYRLRTYNLSDSVIKLECKQKRGDRIKKTGLTVDKKTAAELTMGDFSGLDGSKSPLAGEVVALHSKHGLRPSVIVDYEREAYIYPAGNVRLTFDKSLHAGLSSPDIFDPELLTVPVFPDGSVILEVKYDEFIPYFIRHALSGLNDSRLALSKFCLCRDKLKKYRYRL